MDKDWLLRYGYFFLSQFSATPQIRIGDIKIPKLDAVSLVGLPFELKFHGWLPGDEGPEEYKKRLRKLFDEELLKYFHNTAVDLDLEKIKRSTKPLKYERVNWLVYMIVRGWGVEQIVEKFFPDTAANRTCNPSKYLEYENKLKYVKAEILKFERYDLPTPKGLR